MLRAMQLSDATRTWDLESVLAACDWTDQAVAVGAGHGLQNHGLVEVEETTPNRFDWTLRVSKRFRTACWKPVSGRGCRRPMKPPCRLFNSGLNAMKPDQGSACSSNSVWPLKVDNSLLKTPKR